MKKYIYTLILALALTSCEKETNGNGDTTIESGGRVFICNEGNFMYGNASLSLYDPQKKSVLNQLFYNTNDFPLGDVLQSMKIIDNRGYMVVNNSGKVVVIDIDTYKYLGTIKGLTSPRHIEQVSDTKIYITDLYSNAIAIANPKTYEVTGQIMVGKGTEQMITHGDFVYTCSWSHSNKIYKIDSRNDKIVDSLSVTKQPNSMVVDKNGTIWTLSDGSYIGSPYIAEVGALTKINTSTFSVEQVLKFPDIQASPSELSINHTQDTIYYINGGFGSNAATNGLCRMGVNETTLSTEPFIPENGRLFYGVGIDPLTSEIYLSDAIDYVQHGIILRYSPQGQLLDQFKVDIIPGAFCFKSPKIQN